MRDGKTLEIDRPGGQVEIDMFLGRHEVSLVVITGDGAGGRIRLRGDRQLVGRGPGVDIEINDRTLSRQHAALEYADGQFRIRDLGSTNGIRVNGRRLQVVDLAHGDRIEIGAQIFQYVVERREEEPEVYELDADG
jgi:pSer/pThr/pTyr-binding forkhead associated (FHA) protein